jgi:hypothetical protein
MVVRTPKTDAVGARFLAAPSIAWMRWRGRGGEETKVRYRTFVPVPEQVVNWRLENLLGVLISPKTANATHRATWQPPPLISLRFSPKTSDVLSATPLTYSVRRDHSDVVVFCFAEPEDAEVLTKRFGGERLPTGSHGDPENHRATGVPPLDCR